jgi:hypothetical protein
MYGGDSRLGTRSITRIIICPTTCTTYITCAVLRTRPGLQTAGADGSSQQSRSVRSSDSWKALDIRAISSILARKAHVNKYIMYVKTPHSQPIRKGYFSLEVEARLYVAFALELGKHRMSNTAKSRA